MATVRVSCPTDRCGSEVLLQPHQPSHTGELRVLAGQCPFCSQTWRMVAGELVLLGENDAGVA